MAAPPAASVQWIPEDDLLLKNSVEAGASLEALAKGAVQFSRRYTLRELQERWYSLLYDPDISEQASAHMFELEISGINPGSKLNRSENSFTGNKEILQKRKSESIRRKYYAMRKKFRSEFFSNSDLGFFEQNPHEFSGHGADFQQQVVMHDGNSLGQNCIIGDSISDHLRLHEEDLDILRHAFPGTIRDIAVASNVSQTGCPSSFEDNRRNGIMGGYGYDENATSSLTEGGNNTLEVGIKNRNCSLTLRRNPVEENVHNSSVGFEDRQQFNSPISDDFSSLQTIMFASDQPQLHHWRTMVDSSAPSVPVTMSLQDTAQVAEDMTSNDVEGKENSSVVYTGEFADPDSLLNLSNEDEILLVDEDEKHAENKCCIDNIDSVPTDSNKHDEENNIAEVEPETATVTEACSGPDPSSNLVVLEVAPSFAQGDPQMNRQPDNVPSKSTSNSDFAELRDGKICCTLNTEDPEIPCNDDIFLLIHPSTSFGSSATQPSASISVNASAAAHEKNSEQAVNLPTKAKGFTKAFVRPQIVGIHSLPESHSMHSLVDRAAKTENHDSRPQSLLHGESSKGRSHYAVPKLCSNSLAEKEVAGVDIKVGDNPAAVTELRSAEAGSATTQLPESVVDESVSDEEESQIDDDVPCFSDIEAMILEMDLDPHDQDSHISRQVPSYQYDDSKRTIIRLEQAARSCLQRTMTSQGALAILYGRHLRHYIRKPEVLIGRSTDDFCVDIDLRKEGQANKISRRQAMIKMEADGSFFLKNLGKSSVSVNGISVATGQLLNLGSSCLIEIRGMSFVFEINQGYVRKQLGTFCLENKGKTGKPDWSAEDE